jgi:hypothetical protein
VYEKEDYQKACTALNRRCQRRGWLYQQPGHNASEVDNEGILVLRNVNGELGRYNTQTQRLVAVRGV